MDIRSKDHWVLVHLNTFYNDTANMDRVRDILQSNSKISLRLMDWFVTNYSKKHNVSYLTKDGRHVIVYLVYKARLRGYSKKIFDPFGRGRKFQYGVHNLTTTIAQLQFFKWAIEDEVLDYLQQNVDAVQADMDACSMTLKEGEDGRKKRHELSRSATNSVHRHDVRVSVSFD
jgi:hypothetical protein